MSVCVCVVGCFGQQSVTEYLTLWDWWYSSEKGIIRQCDGVVCDGFVQRIPRIEIDEGFVSRHSTKKGGRHSFWIISMLTNYFSCTTKTKNSI